MTTTEYTPEEIAKMQLAIEEYNAKIMEEARLSAESTVAPVVDVIDNLEFQAFIDQLEQAKNTMADYDQVSSLIDSLVSMAKLLPSSVERLKARLVSEYVKNQ